MGNDLQGINMYNSFAGLDCRGNGNSSQHLNTRAGGAQPGYVLLEGYNHTFTLGLCMYGMNAPKFPN